MSLSATRSVRISEAYFIDPRACAYFHCEVSLKSRTSADYLDVLSQASFGDAVDVSNKCNVTAIAMPETAGYFEFHLLPNVLFVRNFYESLFEFIRSSNIRGVALLGSSGTSKSAYQFYMLKRYLQYFEDEERNSLPESPLFGRKAPEVVIRQVDEEVYLYLLKEKKVYEMSSISSTILNYFAKNTTQFLYEPGRLQTEPTPSHIWTFGSFGTDECRCKRFRKGDLNISCIMPPYLLPELLAIGRYIRSKVTEYDGMLSDENIQSRFDEYGGIIRRVLPLGECAVAWNSQYLTSALYSVTEVWVNRLFCSFDLSESESYAVHWCPERKEDGSFAFHRLKRQFASESVRLQFILKLSKCDINQLRTELKYFTLSSKLWKSVSKDMTHPLFSYYFEVFVALYLCEKHIVRKINTSEVKFIHMVANELYYPFVAKFPVGVMYYKDFRNVLHVVNATMKSIREEVIADILSTLEYSGMLILEMFVPFDDAEASYSDIQKVDQCMHSTQLMQGNTSHTDQMNGHEVVSSKRQKVNPHKCK